MIYTLTLNPAVDCEYRVPALEFNHVLRATTVRSDPGGKGFNVSRMIAQLGGGTTAVGFIGGSSGRWLRERLNEANIQTAFVEVDAETRTNTTIVAEGEDRYIKVNEAGPTISDVDIDRLFNLIDELAHPGEWWVLAGSLPPGCPPSIYATLTDRLKKAGCRVLLDASGEPMRLGCAAGPAWIKPNEVEAAEMTGQEKPTAAALALQKLGIEHVVVSQGRDGALYVGSGRSLQIAPLSIEEKNPIGAGDAFVGGLVYMLDQGADPETALRWGTAGGAAAASLPGTAFGSREQLEKLASDVQLRSVELNE